jgi:transglutaminase-like putative cysteine protease
MKGRAEGSGRASVGYSEEVNVGEWTRFDGDGAGGAVLWLSTESGADPSLSMHLGLVRSKILDRFDGRRWRPGVKVAAGIGQLRALRDQERRAPTVTLDVMRESLSSDALPVPYGATSVLVDTPYGTLPAVRQESGEWTDARYVGRQVHYHVVLANEGILTAEGDGYDRPARAHLEVPPNVRPRLEKLAHQLFRGLRRDSDKVQAVSAFFRQEGFHASTDVEPSAAPALKLSPLERFLFVEKQGHCELFASASALLLRLGGVPTRLVAGFRLSKGPLGGFLTVRSGDAHAWLETWLEGRGWVPLDPTPRALGRSSALDFLRDSYSSLSAYWSRYVLTYGSGFQASLGSEILQGIRLSQRANDFEDRLRGFYAEHRTLLYAVLGGLVALAALAAMILRIWFPAYFSIRYRVREGHPRLRRERLIVEQLLARALRGRRTAWTRTGRAQGADPDLDRLREPLAARFGPVPERELAAWLQLYRRARFGPGRGALDARARELREARRRLQYALRDSA